MVDIKCCNKCREDKPLTCFGNNSLKKDGKAGECRDCERIRKRLQKRNRTPEQKKKDRDRLSSRRAKAKYRASKKAKNLARVGERLRRHKKYHSDPEYRRQIREKLERSKTPEKNYARRRLGKAVQKGKIQKQPCACGATRVQGHHEDYSKPLDVIWMCASCHSKLHRQKQLMDLDSY